MSPTTPQASVNDGLARLRDVAWFADVGRKSTIPKTALAAKWMPLDEGVEQLVSPAWENVTAEAAGDLTLWLHQRCKGDFDRWNDLVAEAKPVIDAVGVPAAERLAARTGVGTALIDCLRWDLVHAVAELAFRVGRTNATFRGLSSSEPSVQISMG